MYLLQRVYGFTPQDMPAVLADRLWPRGVSKLQLAGVMWCKTLAPSNPLRQWFHQDPQTRYAEFGRRYQAELAQTALLPELQILRDLHRQHGRLILLTAARLPMVSHLPILKAVLEEQTV